MLVVLGGAGGGVAFVVTLVTIVLLQNRRAKGKKMNNANQGNTIFVIKYSIYKTYIMALFTLYI